jgi:uncharacterized RDD family membrane protein YckC
MAYQGNPPYDGGPGGPHQGGPSDPGGPYQGGPGGPYQGGPGGPYQGGPGGGPYQGGAPGPYQGNPPAGPYQGSPGSYQGETVRRDVPSAGSPYPGGPYQGGPGPYPGGPYGGGPGYANPAAQYSDWIHRVGAYLVDVVPVLVLYFILGLAGKVALLVVAWVIALAYTAWNRWYLGGQGQSLGKRALGMKLVSEQTGQPIGMLNAFLRDICHIVDSIICYVGYLFPLWDAKRQTLADKIMHTVVVPA